ncbi:MULTISPECIES: hypothetical protein [Pseudomonas]|uniref:Uncharacterized protein n=1 Tax=Pseudomonas fluorescens TaxID=294 RepID=A0A166QQ20_PSEFL|nr:MULTISPECIES: hypothetical protein [Pseudomonas]KZN20665.1 hypothetical protein A1D17_03745 [Pseudomonas fluorescens]
MKKSLMCIALALLATGAQAESKMVELSLRDVANTVSSITALVGQPTPVGMKTHEMASTCNFQNEVPGFPGKPSQSTFAVDASTGISFTFLPVEATDTGVKAYVSYNQNSAQDQEWAVISKDCKLPVGKTSSAGISVFETFKWGEPTKLTLPDGSVVVATVSKFRKAGMDYSKLSSALQRPDPIIKN